MQDALIRWLRASGPIVGFLMLSAIFLAPSLKTGYWGEDLYQSVSYRANVAIHHVRPVDTIAQHIVHTIHLGRFFPLTAMLIPAVHLVFLEAWQYKTYILLGSVLDLWLFYVFLARLTGRRDYACFAACVTLGLIQYRICIDPSIGFFGQMQVLIACFLTSLIGLQAYLDGSRHARAWLAGGALAFLACALLYEIAYLLIAAHFVLIARAPSGRRQRLMAACPFLTVAAICAGLTILVRRMFPGTEYWHRMDFEPWAVARAIWQQTSAALPWSYFLADPAKIFPTHGPVSWKAWASNPMAYLVAMASAILGYVCLRLKEGQDAGGDAIRGRWGWLILLGSVVAVFPSFLLAISPYHRGWLKGGVGWIPVLVQIYGVGLILSAMLWKLGHRFHGEPGRVAASLLLALLVGNTYRANMEVARCFVATPGTAKFRGESAQLGGGYHYHRLQLESALDAGLMEEVPEHARVFIANAYPFWYDQGYGLLFYAAHTGKSFEIRDLSGYGGWRAAGQEYFAVRDVMLTKDSGYVLLAIESAKHGGRPVRLFIRHPDRFRGSDPFPFRLAAGNDRDRSIDPRSWKRVKSGGDWAVYDAMSHDGLTRSDELQVQFDVPALPSLAIDRTSESNRR